MRRSLFAVCAALFLSQSAFAQQPPPQQIDPEQLLQVAEKYYEQLEYEEALKILIQVHQVPGVSPMQRARAFLYMGVCFTALGNAENAVLSFMELLKIKPNFRLPPGISPSIGAMFKEALTRLKLPAEAPPEAPGAPGEQGGQPPSPEEIPVRLSAKAPKEVNAGQPVEVRIDIQDPRKLVQKLVIRWRRVGGPDFSSVKVPYKPGETQVTGRISGATVGEEKGTLQFMVEAVGRGGMTLAHVGSMDAPELVDLTTPKKGKTNWTWWAVGIGGGLAVVGGVVAAILLTRGEENGGPGEAADITVTIH